MENDTFVKSPAFQIYPADFLADKNTLVMSAAEVGAYWLLICVCWRENGLPDDVEELAGLARTSVKQFQESWEKRIKRCFIQRADGRWSHNRLDKEREKQNEWKVKSAEGGKASARKRKKLKSQVPQQGGSPLVQPNSNRTAESGSRVVQPNGNSSFSSSSSISTSKEKKEKRADKPPDPRSNHPAIVAFREIKGRYPTKDLYDHVIEIVGDHPDVPLMRKCWVEWRTRGYQSENYGWIVDWYVNGIPERGGNGKRSYESSTDQRARNLRENAKYIRSLSDVDSEVDCQDPIGLLASSARHTGVRGGGRGLG